MLIVAVDNRRLYRAIAAGAQVMVIAPTTIPTTIPTMTTRGVCGGSGSTEIAGICRATRVGAPGRGRRAGALPR